MKKKEANPYKKSKVISEPPYLTAQEIKDFESEFNLFEEEVDLKRLKDTFLLLRNESQCKKPLQEFISSILLQKNKCNFQEYISLMLAFLEKQNEGELIVKILGSEKTYDIPIDLMKEIIEESLGRDVSDNEFNDITSFIFQEKANESEYIEAHKIKEVLRKPKQKVHN